MKKAEPKEIKDRIAAIRQWMAENSISACIIPQADPHQSEYVEDFYKTRSYFSGFDGSAGTLVVGADKAALWTDSRYFIQAALQLENSGIELCKQGVEGTPTIEKWIADNASDGIVAANAECFSHKRWQQLSETLYLTDNAGFEQIWVERPPKANGKVFIHDIAYCGRSAADKLQSVRQTLERQGADCYIVPNLDDIAWLVNLRGSDVKNNPVFRAYCIVGKEFCHLFVDLDKVSSDVKDFLSANGIGVFDYNEIKAFLRNYKGTIACDFGKLCESVFASINYEADVVNIPMLVAKQRSVKNEVEIEGYRRAMERDGVVWVKFLRWFKENKDHGTAFTEIDVADKLLEFKKEQPLFADESFGTIAGYGEHGALAHYSATEEGNAVVAENGFIVIDSGTHYLDGTTDITRTLNCGEITEQQRKDFTLVLKGHIALANAVFPKGTTGSQLDALARQFLWKNCLNYGHGTGHGVGHFLNVHEGYTSVRPRGSNEPFESGLTMTDEPGIYREGSHGIRTENMLVVRPAGNDGFGDFLRFETLTLCPYDLSAVDADLLSDAEKAWIIGYHSEVCSRLSPLLYEDDKNWLQEYVRFLNSFIE